MSFANVRDAIGSLRHYFEQNPQKARKPNASATAIWTRGLRCEIEGPNGERAVSDMPDSMGGSASGPNPGWYMRAAIASCAATAIAMRAAIKGIELDSLKVHVTSNSDSRGLVGIEGVPTSLDGFKITIEIGAAEADAEQLRELAAWGEGHSPIGCTLRARPELPVEITVL